MRSYAFRCDYALFFFPLYGSPRCSIMRRTWPAPRRRAVGSINSAPLMCAPRAGKNMGVMLCCMSFDTCECKSAINSVPRPRLGMAGGVDFEMSYFILLGFGLC